MKRLRTILALLLLICCALWVASYWWMTWHSNDGRFVWQLRDGGFIVGRFEFDRIADFKTPGMGPRYGLQIAGRAGLPTRWWPMIWFYNEPTVMYFRGTFWLPTLLLSLWPAFTLSPWTRRRRRARRGLCIRCGYDLHVGEHLRCPECGHSQQPLSRLETPP